MRDIPPGLKKRLKEVETKIGKPIILRAVRLPEQNMRGRVTDKRSHILLEYRDDVPGFFWDVDVIRELLTALEEGRTGPLLDGPVT